MHVQKSPNVRPVGSSFLPSFLKSRNHLLGIIRWSKETETNLLSFHNRLFIGRPKENESKIFIFQISHPLIFLKPIYHHTGHGSTRFLLICIPYKICRIYCLGLQQKKGGEIYHSGSNINVGMRDQQHSWSILKLFLKNNFH